MSVVNREDIDGLNKTLLDLRKTFESTTEEARTDRKRLSDTLEKMDKFQEKINSLEVKCDTAIKADELRKQYDESLAKMREDFGKSMESMEATFKSFKESNENRDKPKLSTHQKAFEHTLRKGFGAKEIKLNESYYAEHFGADMAKTLTIGQDLAGGYLAPIEFIDKLVNQNLREFSDIRSLCSQHTTSAQSVIIPVRQRAGGTAYWVSELDTKQRTEALQIGAVEVRTAEMACVIALTNESMENPLFDVEGYARKNVAEEMGLLESQEFLTGPGNGRPEGLLTNANVLTVTTGSDTGIEPDKLVIATDQLKVAYMTGASWIMNRFTINEIRLMKDSIGRYLWQPNFTDGKPAMILNYPYTRAEYMPKIGAGNYPILFGNFKTAYTIVDRDSLSFFLDPYSNSLQGVTVLIARRRVGGKVIVPEAYLRMQNAA